jgi:hypothetical protein|tara:strand:+ start:232 stop:423 length:192 start_codon:yes stop_codon:yes gene_type:complete
MATATKQHEYIKQLEQRVSALENPTSLTKTVVTRVRENLDKPPTQFSNTAATVAAVATILFLN